MYATHSAATDPKPDSLEFVLTPIERDTATVARLHLEYNRRCANARANGTPMPPKPEGVK